MSSTKIDVFYVTYAKDADWFFWSLQTVAKNLEGFRNIVVVCPQQDREIIAEKIFAAGVKVTLHAIPDWAGLGYYWQQWVKMQADTYCPDADFIAHIDSDVFIKSPVALDAFFRDGLPSWLWSFYTDMPDLPWKAPTELAAGIECPREFMQGFPFIIRRDTYAHARTWLERQHKCSSEKYIRRASLNVGPPGFSEFNFLGVVAWESQREQYAFVDRMREEWPSGFHHTRQFWSHAPLEDHVDEIKQMLTGGTDHQPRTTNRGWWVLANDTHISAWVEQTGRLDFDTPFINSVTQHIRPGDVVVDVGAFIGDHTLAYAHATHGKDGGRVLAFEPNPPAFECLRRNMQKLGHVECYNVALAGRSGTATMAIDPNAGASHLIPGDGVDLMALDSLKLSVLNLVKIDAEGMEVEILRGAEETIRRCRPILVLEVNAGALARQSCSAEELHGLLTSLGYRVEGWQEGSPQFDVFCFPL